MLREREPDIRSEISKRGFILLQRLAPGSALTEIADRLGLRWNGSEGASAHLLEPKEAMASTPNTYSGNYGLKAFPLHTDLAHWRLPPRYLILRCKVGSPDVNTLLLDGKTIVEACGHAVLSRALVKPRRPMNGTLPLLRLYQQTKRGLGILRWDQLFIRPASAHGNLAFNLVKAKIDCAIPWTISLKAPGDTLVVDNWRMLHGRSSVPKGGEGRVIERMYLEEIS